MTAKQALVDLRAHAHRASALPALTPEHRALKGFLLGALYALCFSAELKFRDRPGAAMSRTNDRNLSRALRRLGAGRPALSGQWLAGFYFNAGLQRLAGLYHRCLKSITGKEHNAPCLADIALARGLIREQLDELRAVHQDVNDLKHTRDGLTVKGRRVNWRKAVEAARQATELLEATIRIRATPNPPVNPTASGASAP